MMRRVLYALLGMALSFAVFLLAGELLVRLYLIRHTVYDVEMAKYANALKIDSPNPKIGHLHRPNARARLMNVDVVINSDGFRGPEYRVEKGTASRIIFLGDSLTLGWGVEEKDAFASLLEARLGALHPTEVLNFGTGNYNTEQEVNLFLEKGLKYHPDRVVVFYFINDAEATPQKSRLWVLGYSRLVTVYWSRFLALRNALSPEMSFQGYYSALYRDDQQGWIHARKAFLELKAACVQGGMRLQVVLLPELHNLAVYPFRREHGLLTAFLNENAIENLDLAASFAGYKSSIDLWVATDDAHPNARAHKMIADYTFEFLKRTETP